MTTEGERRPELTRNLYVMASDYAERRLELTRNLYVMASDYAERTESTTGGQKGVKSARFDLLPTLPLMILAEHYAKGAAKYTDHNWRLGYEWSKAFAAMQRHAWAFWGGEDIDPEDGTPHMAAVAFHAFTLLQYAADFPEFDDRYKAAS